MGCAEFAISKTFNWQCRNPLSHLPSSFGYCLCIYLLGIQLNVFFYHLRWVFVPYYEASYHTSLVFGSKISNRKLWFMGEKLLPLWTEEAPCFGWRTNTIKDFCTSFPASPTDETKRRQWLLWLDSGLTPQTMHLHATVIIGTKLVFGSTLY